MKLQVQSFMATMVMILVSNFLFSQSNAGSISGIVTDKTTGELLPQIPIQLLSADSTINITQITDFDGLYTFSSVTPGSYTVMAKGDISYTPKTFTNVVVTANNRTSLNFDLNTGNAVIECVEVVYDMPSPEESRSESIYALPTRSIGTVQAVRAGVYQADEGNAVNVRGTRTDANVVFVDGVKVRGVEGVVSVVEDDIEIDEIVTGGTPAHFGDRYRGVRSMYDEMNREEYNENPIAGFSSPITTPLSTFGMDVDKASYFNVKRMIESSYNVPVDAVRTEEFVNAFKYAYEKPEGEEAFHLLSEITPCAWNEEHHILRLTLNTERIEKEDLPPSNMVFLVDVSGSMSGANRLGLVQESLRMLTDQLRDEDRISLVTYAGRSQLVLASTSGAEKQKIKDAIDALSAGGSTNGEGGIQQAYTQALEGFIEEGSNRVVLCTDGDFNVGISSQSALIDMIEKKRSSGVFLSVIGVGQGNYQEGMMEQLANKGNGNFNYFSSLYEAKKVFVEEFSSTLFTVAKDAKVQVEFNPLHVASYRLLGYENRVMPDEDFHDDTKDGGEVGMGHQVTMLYEIELGSADEQLDHPLRYQESVSADIQDEIGTVSIRYKNPDEDESSLFIHTLKVRDEEEATNDQNFAMAVAAFAGILREDEHINMTTAEVVELARSGKGEDEDGERSDFIQLAQLHLQLSASK